MVTVTRSTPMLDKIDKTSKYLKKHGVKVGIFGENAAKEQEGVTIGYYAKCLNFGTSKMQKQQLLKMLKSLVEQCQILLLHR